MSSVFVVIQEGVYRHQVWGALPTESDAIDLATRLRDGEEDGYHDWLVVRYFVSATSPSTGALVATIKGADRE